jgi:sortase A
MELSMTDVWERTTEAPEDSGKLSADANVPEPTNDHRGTVADRGGLRRCALPVVEIAGRLMIVAGGIVLSFVAFQLWGTAVGHDRAQSDLAAELADAIDAAQSAGQGGVAIGKEPPSSGAERAGAGSPGSLVSSGSVGEDAEVVAIPGRPRPGSGEAIARIEAPTIDLDKTVVHGVGRPQLRSGPGLYPISPLPGHQGNVAIAGHRTTHGSPFADLDQLAPGDPIVLETVDGVFTYRVEGQRTVEGQLLGHRIVDPGAVEVIADLGDNRLTLTSCHPRYSDRERLIVTAVLEGSPVAFPEDPAMAGTVAGRVAETQRAAAASNEPGEPGARSPEAPVNGADTTAITGLEQPLGWQLDHLPGVTAWTAVLLCSLVPARVLQRRGRRVSAALALVVFAGYPFASLLARVDAMAPAW